MVTRCSKLKKVYTESSEKLQLVQTFITKTNFCDWIKLGYNLLKK